MYTHTQKYFVGNIEQNLTNIISFLSMITVTKLKRKSAYKNWDFIDLNVSSNDSKRWMMICRAVIDKLQKYED